MNKMKNLSIFTLNRRRFGIVWVLRLALIIFLTACASDKPFEIDLMPAPNIYEDGTINPLSDTDPIKKIPYGGILYATDNLPMPSITSI